MAAYTSIPSAAPIIESAPALQPAATPLEAERAVQAARDTFSRTLACWAGDLLTLRRRVGRGPAWTDPRLRQAA